MFSWLRHDNLHASRILKNLLSWNAIVMKSNQSISCKSCKLEERSLSNLSSLAKDFCHLPCIKSSALPQDLFAARSWMVIALDSRDGELDPGLMCQRCKSVEEKHDSFVTLSLNRKYIIYISVLVCAFTCRRSIACEYLIWLSSSAHHHPHSLSTTKRPNTINKTAEMHHDIIL